MSMKAFTAQTGFQRNNNRSLEDAGPALVKVEWESRSRSESSTAAVSWRGSNAGNCVRNDHCTSVQHREIRLGQQSQSLLHRLDIEARQDVGKSSDSRRELQARRRAESKQTKRQTDRKTILPDSGRKHERRLRMFVDRTEGLPIPKITRREPPVSPALIGTYPERDYGDRESYLGRKMPPRCSMLQGTSTPFLFAFLASHAPKPLFCPFNKRRHESTTPHIQLPEEGSHLNPPPTDYSRAIFTDRATVTVHAGNGGHGCISFLREKYIEAGPANGGDGGTGGNVYIQAMRGETSLHKLARRNFLKAGRGKNGQGKSRSGERGDDILVEVPVGTVVREVERVDPVAIEEERMKLEAGKEHGVDGSGPWKWSREKWLLYPAITPEDVATAEFPSLPRGRKSPLMMAQVKGPISLDLSKPMERPLLLVAGAMGGLGNPHFCTKTVPRPKFATKGEEGVKIVLELELKLLADVGLVGLPNAGKSTLLRAMSRSRARVGNWEFTTLQPNIGTVVLDDHKGRPLARAHHEDGEPRTHFTIADIPGLVADAHLDKGLGISFLRHVERARLLAFVIDLSRTDAVTALKGLWKEVGEYERLKVAEEKEKANPVVHWSPFTSPEDALANRQETIVISSGPNAENPLAPEMPSITRKPWFVVATKADLEGTKENFEALRQYLKSVDEGSEEHPSGQRNCWTGKVDAIPVSAINGHGMERITEWTVGLLDD